MPSPPAPPAGTTWTLNELATALGVAPRTLRSWFASGLLPTPPFHGAATRYDATHLRLGRAVLALRARTTRLAEIRKRLAKLTPEQLDALIAPLVPQPTVSLAQRPPPAEPSYAHERWQRVVLVPGLELMVREDAPVGLRRLAQDIVAHYGAGR